MKIGISKLLGKTFLPAVLAGVLAGQVEAASFKLDAAMKKKIDAEAQQLIDAHLAPGLAVGVMVDGKIVYAKGFGAANLETDTRVTPDTVFRIGSLTKPFTATAIMILAEQGKLSVDDPLSKYFPDFPRANEVTIREMLTHTSGIPEPMPSPAQMAMINTTADAVAHFKSVANPYDFEPGMSRRYSNAGYILLGAIIEKVSGLSLAEFMKRNIFDRAGMKATAVDKETDVVPNRAMGYQRESDTFVNSEPPHLVFVGATGAMRSTVGDILQWQNALLSGRIISSQSLKAMTTPVVGKNGQILPPGPPQAPDYGFGLGLGADNGHPFITHNGGISGFGSDFKAYTEDGVAIVAFANTQPMGRPGPPPTQGGPPGPLPPGAGSSPAQGSPSGPPPPGAGPPAAHMVRFISKLVTGAR